MIDHQTAVLSAVLTAGKGMRTPSILKRTGITRDQLDTAYHALETQIMRIRMDDGNYLYKAKEVTPIRQRMATPRQAIPMHALHAYTGETKRAGAVL